MFFARRIYNAQILFVGNIVGHISVCSTRNLSFSHTKLQKCSKPKTRLGPPWKILFFGTDRFSLESLKPLCAKLRTGTLMSALGIVTKRGSKVREFAEAEKLPIYDWPLPSFDFVKDYDIGMVVSFGNLIPKIVIDNLPLGCINIHASLLPRWRGASPIIHAIMNGDTETGVTIMRIHPHKFDIGEIVRQYRVPISWNETAEQLENKLSVYGAQMLMECLRDLPRCVEKAAPQPQNGITYAPKISSSMAMVEWSKMEASEVYNLHRALHHVYPLTTRWNGRIIKLQSIELDKDIYDSPKKVNLPPQESTPKSALAFLNSASDFPDSTQLENKTESPLQKGKIIAADSGVFRFIKVQKLLKVVCSDGHCILLRKLSISGKTMSAMDFYNGFLTKQNKSEWKFTC